MRFCRRDVSRACRCRCRPSTAPGVGRKSRPGLPDESAGTYLSRPPPTERPGYPETVSRFSVNSGTKQERLIPSDLAFNTVIAADEAKHNGQRMSQSVIKQNSSATGNIFWKLFDMRTNISLWSHRETFRLANGISKHIHEMVDHFRSKQF